MTRGSGFSLRRRRIGALPVVARHRPLIALAAMTCAVAVAACGSASNDSRSARHNPFLPYSECMRSHGVPNFPDPSPLGGIQLGPGMDPSAPAFFAARGSCQKLLPGGGPGAEHPTAQAEAETLQISQRMRRHGVSGFPDPTLKPPSSVAGYSIVENRGGVVLAVPSTIDPGSPVFKQAAAACGFR